ncbi:MAG: hypothetical protein H0W92_01525 [Sphingomonas sp.]|nr:hypothetical protein [Sphingomonas sp.]
MLAVRLAAAALVLAAIGAPAAAVGLGPLSASGITGTERKGFYLTLINPFPKAGRFRVYSTAWDSEQPAARVLIPVARPIVGPNSRRRVLVIATGLQPGELHSFRVCAERVDRSGESLIHARVCSKLTARRVA